MSFDVATVGGVTVGVVVAGVVALGTLVVWLVGLALALRGSQPADRAAILRAYAALRVPGGRGGKRR